MGACEEILVQASLLFWLTIHRINITSYCYNFITITLLCEFWRPALTEKFHQTAVVYLVFGHAQDIPLLYDMCVVIPLRVSDCSRMK